MRWIDTVQIPYFTFENLAPGGWAVNAFTTKLYRKDGVMNDFFQPLLRRDSDPQEVQRCITLLTAQFGTDPEHLIPSAQKHTANIHVITDADLGPEDRRAPLQFIDGLITDRPGVLLQTFGADCPTVYLTDPVHKAIGLCHSGRKGTQQHIAAVMLKAMSREYQTLPQDVFAAVSPGICKDCYEVGDDVALEFMKEYLLDWKEVTETGVQQESGHVESQHLTGNTENHPEASARTALRDLAQDLESSTGEAIAVFQNGKYHLDLAAAILASLRNAGVPMGHMEKSPLCTRCRSDLFYSFRAEGRISSENSALLMIPADEGLCADAGASACALPDHLK